MELQKYYIKKHSVNGSLYINEKWEKICKLPTIRKIAHKYIRVYYKSDIINPDNIPRYLCDIPTENTGGDKHIILQNGEYISSIGKQIAGLLTPEERRIARKKAIISLNVAFAYGGYNSDIVELETPELVVIITVAGPQFEVDYLEAIDFIDQPKNTYGGTQLFPHYYNKNPQTLVKIPNCKESIIISAYETAMIEDCSIILMGFDRWITEMSSEFTKSQGWLQIPAIGMGYFAKYNRETDISPILLPIFVKSLEKAIEMGKFKSLKVIELMDFTMNQSFKINKTEIGGIKIIHSAYKSILNFTDEAKTKYICGIVNAGDCFALPGNEPGYYSVEAMIGENTSIRMTQTYINNAEILNKSKWIPL